MAHNELGPAFVKIYYTTGSTPHVQTLEIALSGTVTPGVEPDVLRKDGSTIPADIVINSWCEVAKALYKATDTFTGYEIYQRPGPGLDPLFIYANDLTVVGTSGGATLANGQAVFTFGTIGGGLLKIYLMEPTVAADTRNPLKTTTPGSPGLIAGFILGATAFIRGRDGTFPVRGIYTTTKINDTLRKKTLLDQ